jgi:hypothetical protein
MSIPVDLAALQDQISQFGSSALLVTTSTEGPPHVASVVVTFEAGDLSMRVGRRTLANASGHPAVALVWPAGTGGDYCLIVDATTRDEPADVLVVRPTSAVLHRLASAPADIPRCLPLDERPSG